MSDLRHGIATLVLAWVAFAWSACASPDSATDPPLQLLWASDRAGELDLYLTDFDTTRIERLTETEAREYGPTWSSDGGSIVYTRWDGPTSDVWIMDVATRTQQNLTNSTWNDGAGHLSPDGHRLAFASTRSEPTGEIYTMRVDGTDVRRYTFNEVYDTSPRYSPRGDRIAFCRQTLPPPEAPDRLIGAIWVVDVRSGQEVQVTESDRFDCLPEWSPDGRRLAFHGCFVGPCQIYTLELGTMAVKQFTDDAFDNRWPAWSPDGRWISYTSSRDTGTDIWVRRVDGSEERRVTSHPGRDEAAAWRPLPRPVDPDQ